ncbi:MAG: SLC13 family permease [Candidatus Micrarchaeota archaeon]
MENLKPKGLFISSVIAVIILLLPLGLDWKAQAVLSIAALMGSCWFTEAMPLHVTALFGTFLLIISGSVSANDAFAGYFNPTIALFFGGLVLALAMSMHGLDRKIASFFMGFFGTEPNRFILGIMVATTFLSFWISNTATAAIMLPIALFTAPGAKGKPSSYAKAVAIGVAFAATIGGMGTIIGTPPNAIAAGKLAEMGIAVSFLDWSFHALPLVCLLIPASWLVIVLMHKPDIRRVKFKKEKGGWTRDQIWTLAIGTLTVALWMASSIHRIPDGAVSIFAVVLLYCADLIRKDDVSKIDWGVLLLLGGSMALGSALESSGLSDIIGRMLSDVIAGQGEFGMFLAISAFGTAVTAGMSNTSTAALIVPIVAALPPVAAGAKDIVILAGLAASFNFLSPAGTPPSAMAFSSGKLRVWDMVKVGIPITLIALALSALIATFVW